MSKICQSCNHPIKENFCANCGEKKFEQKDLSLKLLIGDFFNALTFLDNKFLKSFYLLFRRPGHLSEEYLRGSRVKYMKPIALFFIANLAYFLFSPLNDFRGTLSNILYHSPYGELFIPEVKALMNYSQLDWDAFSSHFNKISEDYSRSFIILNIPVFTSIMFLLLRRIRPFYIEHFVFGLHLYSALLLIFVLIPGFVIFFTHVTGIEKTEMAGQVILTLLILTYMVPAIKRFYVKKWWQVGLVTLLTMVSFFITGEFYKFVLFLFVLQII